MADEVATGLQQNERRQLEPSLGRLPSSMEDLKDLQCAACWSTSREAADAPPSPGAGIVLWSSAYALAVS